MRIKRDNFNYKKNTLRTQFEKRTFLFENKLEKTPFVLGEDYSNSNIIWVPIVKDIEINIPIPEGYQVVSGKEMCVQTSFDQHNITPVVIKEQVLADLNFADDPNNVMNMDTCVDVFKVKLVGNLYYNSVVSNFEPIGSRSKENDTLFNSYGGIVFNDILAYVDDIDQVPYDVKDSLTYNMIVNSVKINLTNSSIKAQDLNNTQSNVTVSITMVVTSNQGPIS